MEMFNSVILLLLLLASCGKATNPKTVFKAPDRYQLEIGESIQLTLFGKNGSVLTSHHASSVYRTDGAFKRCVMGGNELDVCLQWGHHIFNVSIADDNCLLIQTSQPTVEGGEVISCFPYEEVEWYGGPERYYQNWPIQTEEIDNQPLLTGYDWQSVVSSLWLNSKGASIYVYENVTLFVDSNKRNKGELCLISRVAEPYNTERNTTELNYQICADDNPVNAYRAAVERYLGKPSGRPANEVFKEPIYSTWVRMGRGINQEKMVSLVEEIKSNSFPIGQIEIDDTWEPCYGAWHFDDNKFPSISNFTDYVHSLGGRVTAWIYPFINNDCDPNYQEALDSDVFVKGSSGDVTTTWWCGTGGAIDFTKPEAAEWYLQKLLTLKQESGLDSFKFDAGEANYLPAGPVLNLEPGQVSNVYSNKYVQTVSNFSGLMEVRVGSGTQQHPVLVRMMDKDSRYGLDNGLKSVITSLFQISLAGYPFVLPDMIGGNQYGDKIDKDLFIRWLQATTFMPTLQFSVLPWDFDQETTEISRQYVALHASYAGVFEAAADKAVADGTPINTPIWWIAPDDADALACSDEYLLNGKVLVAPVTEAGVTQRDIYLPEGTWFNVKSGQHDGPVWLRNYSAPLDTLPYFLLGLDGDENTKTAGGPVLGKNEAKRI